MILISRLLTRSGDQAWDFAVPLALLAIYPNEIRVAALYYLAVRVGQVVILPPTAALIDRMKRLSTIRLGIGSQSIGVLGGSFAILALQHLSAQDSFQKIFWFSVLVITGLVSSLGSSFSEIAVGNDIVPTIIPENELSKFNSRLRQVDLFTEVSSPVLAGLLMSISMAEVPQAGLIFVAVWNLVSFAPEYILIALVLRERPELDQKAVSLSTMKTSISQKLVKGWASFFKEPVWPAVACYALLWLSVLSPHGVLLTVFLKDGWKLPEWEIGIFRAAGAVFGLFATLLFPIAVQRFGLIKSSFRFLLLQTTCLLTGFLLFQQGSRFGQIGFLMMILISRIGLYGFSLGEMQIRQVGIAANKRGEVNGFANALTGLATIALFAGGALLPSTDEFKWLVMASVSLVTTSCICFWIWLRRQTLTVN